MSVEKVLLDILRGGLPAAVDANTPNTGPGGTPPIAANDKRRVAEQFSERYGPQDPFSGGAAAQPSGFMQTMRRPEMVLMGLAAVAALTLVLVAVRN